MARTCGCPEPTPRVSPGKDHTCVRCGDRISEDWTSNDMTVAEFFDALEDAIPASNWIADFRLECEVRERAGRKKFGHRYLARDNVRDALEEGSDGALYAFFESLRLVRAGKDPQLDRALTAAYHFGMACAAVREMRRAEHGVPTSVFDGVDE